MATATAIIVGSAIAAVGAIGASGINAASTASTNRKQEDLMHEQMAYQTGEREATQEYNSPANQRQRYEEAGINPYLALGQMDAGNTSAQTAPSAPQLQVPQYGDIIQALGDSINSGVGDYQQLEMSQLGLEQQKVDTRYKLTEKILDINNQIADLRLKQKNGLKVGKEIEVLEKQRDTLANDLEFSQKSMSDRLAFQHSQAKIAQLDEHSKELQNQYQEWFNDFSVKHGDAQLAEIRSIIQYNVSAAALNGAMSAREAAQKTLLQVEEKGIKIDNFQKNKINYLIREQVRLGNQYQRYTNDNFWKTKFLDIFGTGAAGAAGAYLGAKGARSGKARPVKGFAN